MDLGIFGPKSQHISGSHDPVAASQTLAWARPRRPGLGGMTRMKEEASELWSQAKGMGLLFLETQRVRDSL